MKIRRFIFILAAIVSFSLVGCQNESDNSKQPTDVSISEPIAQPSASEPKPAAQSDRSVSKPIVQESKETTDTVIIQATPTDPRTGEVKMETKLSDFTLDFDMDGVEEKVELYTSAERLEDGNMIWDDGQNWLLLVEDGDEYYPLLQQYVQLGEVYFNVWYDHEGVPNISAIIPTGANMNFVNYTYDKEQKGYRVETVYNKGNINLMFSSIPSY